MCVYSNDSAGGRASWRFDVAPMKIDQNKQAFVNSRTNPPAQANPVSQGMATRTDCSGPGGGRLNDDR